MANINQGYGITGPYMGSYQNSNPYSAYQPAPLAQHNDPSGGILTVFVSSEEEVNNYPVAAGINVLLVSFNLQKFWLKGTDTSGIPRQVRTFTFTETTPAQQASSDTVTRAEFTELRETLNKLVSELGGK